MPRNEITVSTRGTAHNGIEFQNHIANSEKTRAAKITNVNLTRLGNVPENITPQLLILENDPTVTKEKGQVDRNMFHSCVGHSIQFMISHQILQYKYRIIYCKLTSSLKSLFVFF